MAANTALVRTDCANRALTNHLANKKAAHCGAALPVT
ncbi:MAG: hypothetical protein JWQ16_1494 [Novosphingobium sp.]|nr:hypothetical protein [Novosphingobium sp.]